MERKVSTSHLPLTTVCGFLVAFIPCPSQTMSDQVTMCPEGWFGSTCELQCHCAILPCEDDGGCTNNKCTDGYFGSGCQYVDMLFSWNKNTDLYLYDQDHTTCNNDKSATSVSLQFRKPVFIYWLRIRVNKPSKTANVTLARNGIDVLCKSQRNFFVNNKILDVLCTTPNPVDKVVLSGDVAAAVCAVYVSQGRNIALKQHVSQSSILGPFASRKAVDGDRNPNMRSGSCACTRPDWNEWWSITFAGPSIVFKVVIIPDLLQKLQNFVLQTFDEKRSVTNSYRKTNGTGQPVIEIDFSTYKPSTSMIIKIEGAVSLALCEVEIYAESWCPDGYYGLECKRQCQCQTDQTCHLATGVCGEGCPTFYGVICAEVCPVNCLDKFCYQRSGECMECTYGYTGRFCSQECPPNTFGQNCSRTCPSTCDMGMCDRESGDCLSCKPGHYGPRCEPCPPDAFGDNCSIICPNNCEYGSCAPQSSACLLCRVGFYKPDCLECTNNTYGMNCAHECVASCHGKCDKVQGHCLSCEKGRYGPYCRAMTDDINVILILPIFVVLLLIIPICLFYHEHQRVAGSTTSE